MPFAVNSVDDIFMFEDYFILRNHETFIVLLV